MISKGAWLLLVPVALLVAVWFLVDLYINSELDSRLLENEVRIEETIDEAVEEVYRHNPHGDPDISLNRLRRVLGEWE